MIAVPLGLVIAYCLGVISAMAVFAFCDPQQQWRKALAYKRKQRAARKRPHLSSREINRAANAYLPPVEPRCPDCMLVVVGRAGRVRHELVRCAAHAGEHFSQLEQELGP